MRPSIGLHAVLSRRAHHELTRPPTRAACYRASSIRRIVAVPDALCCADRWG